MPVRVLCPLLLLLVLLPFGAAKERESATADLARRVVADSAGVREDDRVHINGTPADADLLEELAVAVRRRGGHPLITLTSDRLRRRLLADVPAKFDRQTPRMETALAETADVLIATEATDEGALFGLPPERMVAQQKAAEPAAKTLLRRNVRTVYLGNGLYPSPARAKRFGLTTAKLREIYEAGLAADVKKIAATGERLRKRLAAAKELRIRSQDGTDLRMSIEKRPVLTGDGLLTPEKVKKGGAAVVTWLPAGEVYVTPAAGSGEGTVAVPVAYWEGRRIEKLKLTFKAGKLVKMSAASGLDRLRKVYGESGPGKDLLGAVDVGINPDVVVPSGSGLVSYVPAGTVTVAFGNNTWAGGDNSVPFGLSCHLPAATLTADGRVIVERGKLNP